MGFMVQRLAPPLICLGLCGSDQIAHNRHRSAVDDGCITPAHNVPASTPFDWDAAVQEGICSGWFEIGQLIGPLGNYNMPIGGFDVCVAAKNYVSKSRRL